MRPRKDTNMQEIMRIGDEFVPADDDLKDIGHASTEITDVAQKYKADVLAIIGKGDKHHLVAQHYQNGGELEKDIIKAVSLVQTIAHTYEASAIDIAEIIKAVVAEEEE